MFSLQQYKGPNENNNDLSIYIYIYTRVCVSAPGLQNNAGILSCLPLMAIQRVKIIVSAVSVILSLV